MNTLHPWPGGGNENSTINSYTHFSIAKVQRCILNLTILLNLYIGLIQPLLDEKMSGMDLFLQE